METFPAENVATALEEITNIKHRQVTSPLLSQSRVMTLTPDKGEPEARQLTKILFHQFTSVSGDIFVGLANFNLVQLDVGKTGH